MKIAKFVFSILIAQLAGFIGAFFTVTSGGSWYEMLEKPIFNPPGWIFGPVWTLLYFLLGISLYLVLVKRKKLFAVMIFSFQWVLNVLWSYLFFGLQDPVASLVGIIILWLTILLMMIKFYRVNKWAAYCNIPYLLWVSFATVLNLSIVILN
jgi:translocator protein